jgi:hypothetical protein
MADLREYVKRRNADFHRFFLLLTLTPVLNPRDLIGLLGFHNEPGSGLEPPYLVYKTKALPIKLTRQPIGFYY